ncbi:hypothetical protein LAZ40_11045 [Cereibacter sphaeroides]|uniref:hypothetical protein n=1 Tax=Cereibacter sphaeroides TaxID=1063 RepID=UPI001F28F5E4|nr:hypothetical protein [Cereibacter sphaeroides]MCE6959592.1 hypothetical protein [Cereibacter sphaeroides]MCE6974548.1 hypothetical protein [Cereibacter sphaeroides]
MHIDLKLDRKDLTLERRIDLLAQIAEGMARECREGPREAILSLLSAAALLARENSQDAVPERLEALGSLLDLGAEAVESPGKS